MAAPLTQEPSSSTSNEKRSPAKGGAKSTEAPQKDPSKLKKIWAAVGLDFPTLMIMLKGAIPPIIALAAYQGTAWADKYTTLGYLISIMALLGFCIQPRAKFLQTIIMDIIFTCLTAAMSLLQLLCVTAARQVTTPPRASPASGVGGSGSQETLRYNASASALSGLGLFIIIYLISVLKSKRPQLQLPAIISAVFTVVVSCYAPSFPSMAVAKSFTSRLLQIFLTGFGISAGVSLFIFPVTSRMIVTKQTAGFLGLLKKSLMAHGKYMANVSASHHQADTSEKSSGVGGEDLNTRTTNVQEARSKRDATLADNAIVMKKTLSEIGALFGKLRIEVGFAKKEIAFGKLDATDYENVILHLRDILLPVVGMTTFIDIMQSVKDRKKANIDRLESDETIDAIRRLEGEEWDEVFMLSFQQFKTLHHAMLDGITHISTVLEFTKPSKKKGADVEKGAGSGPGEPGFAASLEDEISTFYKHRAEVMREWCERKHIRVPDQFWDNPNTEYPLKDSLPAAETLRRRENQQQLYLILYLQFLTWSIGKAILKMVKFADAKVEDGTMKKKHLINPGWRRIKKLFESAFARDEDTDYGIEDGELGASNIYLGDSFNKKKDPEHLPPTTFYENITDRIRIIPRFLSSQDSVFGFRSAVATMSIGILAFLEQTQQFFLKQRLLWALIMLAISLTVHAGQGIFTFVLKIIGSIIAMVISYAIWYICDEKPAAIVPILYIYLCLCFYFVVKFPKYVIVSILSMVTVIIIIGYELQERKIGLKRATSNGQPYYHIYELAPYRLATVVGGIAVAFIWTYFPYPVTTHSTLRKDLGRTLYLLANFYSCVRSTFEIRLTTGVPTDPTKKKSPAYRLDKARDKVFGKCVIMLEKLREHSAFAKFEPKFGGKFPAKTYDELIQVMQNLFNLMALISYCTNTFVTESTAEESGWLQNFRHFMSDLRITSHDITSTLCLVSASVTNAQPLPPYLRLPKPYDIGLKMEAVDPEILSVKHVSEPCYAAFAVLEIASTLVAEDLGRVVKLVQEIVGEIDFSFHIISTSSESSSTAGSSTTLANDSDSETKGKQE